MNRFILLNLLTLVLFSIQCSIVTVGNITVNELRCEYLTDPLGIDVIEPRLSWILESSQRGQSQTAFQILVSLSKDNLKDNIGELWDTGKNESNQNIHIVYRGKKLHSRMHCYWKVRVWDQEGSISEWSEPAKWTMGLLNPDDWQAQWIGYDTNQLNEDPELQLPPVPYFRKRFETKDDIAKATVYVSSLGLFQLSINGQRVGKDYFTPGWTNYNKRVYYITYDVTDFVKEGENAIGALLANGWYSGYVGFALLCNYPKPRAIYGDIPALFAQLEIEYENGEREVIKTDKSWKASTGAIRKSDILMGESYDARREMSGWDQYGYADHFWHPCTIMKKTQAVLEAYPGVTIQKTDELKPVEITEPQKGTYIFNMGQNFAGRARLKVKGKSGTKVVMRFAEMLHKDGTIMTENLRKARATDTYILRGSDQAEIWEPEFTYHGFQYVEVTGYPGIPEFDAITGIVLHSATPVVGSFECSNEIINKLYRNITWTQRANFFEVPTDCPQRDERLGWTGDAQTYIRSATYNMDVASFFTKWLVALEDDQRPYGAYPDYAPWPYPHHKDYSPAWMDAGVICPYTIYKVYGDTRIIERHFIAMKKFMDFLLRTSDNFIRPGDGNSWGDWLSAGEITPKDLIATAFFAYDAKLMSEMAGVIGRQNDSRMYDDLFSKIKSAFIKKYTNADGKIKAHTQSSYALALYMDLLPKHLRDNAARYLVKLLKERDWNLSTGFLGVKHILPVLTKFGYSDIAFRLLKSKRYPSWGYSVVNGATTIWERWNSYTKDKGFANPSMNSFSHYAFGSVCQWMFTDMAGIDTDGPGFKKIIIRPHIDRNGITYTKASFKSINGQISTHWQIEENKLILNIEIPVNTRALVYIPSSDIDSITENGEKIKDSEGIDFIGYENNQAIFSVGSGDYRFRSMLMH